MITGAEFPFLRLSCSLVSVGKMAKISVFKLGRRELQSFKKLFDSSKKASVMNETVTRFLGYCVKQYTYI